MLKKFTFNRGEAQPVKQTTPKPRQPRSDKRVRSTQRIAKVYDDMIKTIAFNHDTSKQKVIDRILRLVLESDTLRSQLIHSFPKSAKHTYIFTDDRL